MIERDELDTLHDGIIPRDYEAGERRYSIVFAPYGGWTFWEQLAIAAELGVTAHFDDPTAHCNLAYVDTAYGPAIRMDEL